MGINFAMWKKAAWELIQMDDKSEWDALDVVSKWLIATRSAVTTVTLYSAVIAGVLAWRDGFFSFWPWLIVTLGLFVAHGTNNLLNDYTDYTRGVDKDNYFRTQYGVHPLVQGFWSRQQQIQWFLVSGVIAFLSGIFALWYTQANPYIIALFALGSLVLLFYTWPMKYWAIGELSIFLIWGPIMIAGVYLVLALGASGSIPASLWMVALAGVPFGLSVASINVAKHTDKLDDDKKKGVGTYPVRVGQTFARYTAIATILIAYGVVIYLVAVGYFSIFMLLVLFALKRAFFAIAVLTKPRPEGPPAGFEVFWPTWFSGFAFYHNRLFGGLFVLGIVLDLVFRQISLPLGINWLGAIALAIGLAVAGFNFVKEKAK
ncbi:MAG: prenyltransferase [Anaerolineales bacterium]|jgi:1,4-dihydroxy-2-naphthoate octaprenyltransferase|nr:prenyltransferase [Anaerolineales bacterium]